MKYTTIYLPPGDTLVSELDFSTEKLTPLILSDYASPDIMATLKNNKGYRFVAKHQESEHWFIHGKGYHRTDGPAIVEVDYIYWFINGVNHTFDEFCVLTNKSDEDRLLLKLQWSNHKDVHISKM